MTTQRALIQKEFHFSASHQLTHLLDAEPDHPCARLHGHNYVVTLSLRGDINPATGFVLDYGTLKQFQQYIDQAFDHRHLNDVCGSAIETTAENLAHRFNRIALCMFGPLVHSVQICETPKTSAEVVNVAEF